MGERLVTRVFKSATDYIPIMSVYQHCSAYSISVYMETKRIYNALAGKETEKDMLASLAKEGIYPCREEFYELCQKYGFDFDKDNIKRNEGIIAVNYSEMILFERYAERTACIYLDTGHGPAFTYNGNIYTIIGSV